MFGIALAGILNDDEVSREDLEGPEISTRIWTGHLVFENHLFDHHETNWRKLIMCIISYVRTLIE